MTKKIDYHHNQNFITINNTTKYFFLFIKHQRETLIIYIDIYIVVDLEEIFAAFKVVY